MPSLKKKKHHANGIKQDTTTRPELDPERMPRHIAIIMDGNGRWAKLHGYKSRIYGHRAGIKSVREIVEVAAEIRIKALSLYAFSKENWLRPRNEVLTLMRLLALYVEKELKRLLRNNIRLVVSGDIGDLPDFAVKKLQAAIQDTKQNTGMTLNLCLSYGGRDEIVHAVRRIAELVKKGELAPPDITRETVADFLYHPELEDPDLLIRTSGELRISNFLLWQIAYTEIYVTQVLWPDFRREHLLEAIFDFQHRERRFGKVF